MRGLLPGVVFAAALSSAAYLDITARSKLDFTLENSPTSQKYLPETMGGGVALLDYDNDGRLDIFFVNGARIDDPMPPGKAPDKSDPRFWNRLYHQNPDGTFSDVTARAGLTGMPQNRYGMGVAVGDFDNDGFEDLYVTGFGGNTLYHNNGDGTFTDVTARAGVAAAGWSASAGFFDYDNDGKLDLFVTRYVDWTFETNRFCGENKPGGRAYCHPDNYRGVANILYHNNGDGTFTDVSLPAGVGFNADGKTFAGMGVDFADYDNDGRPDIVVTDLSNERYMLFRNNGDGSFTDVTDESGLGRATLSYSGWSTRFLDYDNDGWKDLFAAQGHVMDNIAVTSPNLKYMQPPLLLRNTRGHFSRADAGDTPWAGRGAAFGDIDNDGGVDIVAANIGQKAYILRNEAGNRNGWLRIRARGVKSNRDGIGCRVKVTGRSGLVQHYTINTAVGYLSASDKRLTIGLGADDQAKLVEIRWPSGILQKFENVPAGKTLDAVEPVK